MAKSNSANNKPTGGKDASGISYAYKPAKIGAVIKDLMEKKKITKQMVAAFMKVTVRCVEYWLTVTYLSDAKKMRLSELFQEDLFALYHGNVEPLPNPLQEDLDRVKGYVKSLEEIEAKYEKLLFENKSLRDQVQLLKDVIKDKD